MHNLPQHIDGCDEKDLDQAMNYLPNFIKGLKGFPNYYRFIDYDTHAFGTHRKLYSWTKQSSRRYDCSVDPNVAIKRDLELFPEEVSWKERDVVDIEDDLKIIY